jgi:hypothetical protein
MKCINCGEEAGRKGNRHVKSRKFICARLVKRVETRRKWYGAREENVVLVEAESLSPSHHGLFDWRSSDEYTRSYSDSRFDDYYGRDRYTRDDSYSSRSYDHIPSKSDESWSSSRSYDSTPSHSSWDSGSSSSSSDSSSSGSSWGSSSSGSSYDSGSSSSSSSSDSGGW